jgi:hypothetical protein
MWNIISHQCSETNVMHILFSLLRIKGLYMCRALLAHPQEALHELHLVYCVRVMSVGCTRLVQPTLIRLMLKYYKLFVQTYNYLFETCQYNLIAITLLIKVCIRLVFLTNV